MRFLVAALCAVLVKAAVAAAETVPPSDWNASPLLAEGPLLNVREPLSQIFQFKIEDGHLKIDRAAWQRDAKEYETANPAAADNPFANLPAAIANDPQAAAQFQLMQKMFQLTADSMGPPPPLIVLFRKIRAQAGAAPEGSGTSGIGDEAEWHHFFRGGNLSGDVETKSGGAVLILKETKPPRRTLQFNTLDKSGFRIQLSDQAGDMISLQQSASGRFSLVAMVAGNAFADQRNTFVEFFKQNRRRMETDVLPALANFGIRPILAPSDPVVRNAASASLTKNPEVLAEAHQLLTDLDSDNYDTREKASALLSRRYALYKDLIQERLQDPSNSAESQARLERIVLEQADWELVVETIEALDLTGDPSYIVSLFDDADSRDVPRIIERLETLTGKKLGTDSVAWKEWAQKSASQPKAKPR